MTRLCRCRRAELYIHTNSRPTKRGRSTERARLVAQPQRQLVSNPLEVVSWHRKDHCGTVHCHCTLRGKTSAIVLVARHKDRLDLQIATFAIALGYYAALREMRERELKNSLTRG